MIVSAQQLRKESNLSIDDDEFLSQAEGVATTKKASLKPVEAAPVEATELPKGNITSAKENNEKRQMMIAAKSFEPVEFAFERAIGNNDSIYSNFVELLALTKRKVCRIVLREAGKQTGSATGFMVSSSLMLTNWHVFMNERMALESEAHFFYEFDTQGHPQAPVVFRFDTTKFVNSEELDYCFVGLQPTDFTGKVPLSSIGSLHLDKDGGKISDKELLNIIHHPMGLLKQISIRANEFVGVDERRIFYKTDTAPGSSGSPVFNDQWQVVGLHHKSVAKMSEDGTHFLDKNGAVIPVVAEQIDSTKVVWEMNEGMRISVILKHLELSPANKGILAELSRPLPAEKLSFTINLQDSIVRDGNLQGEPTNNVHQDFSNQHITIQVPTAALGGERSIDISLSSNCSASIKPLPNQENGILHTSNDKMDELLLEVAKAVKEEGVDFSGCKGYDANFLGVNVPFPQPKKELHGQLAHLKDKSLELKYFKYSVIFNAVARLPLISGVNVEGNASKRLDNSRRQDDWLRDARIPVECQLTDKFYAFSHFDKGHMSRFEDANWDNTEKEALRNGIFTCFYTNACPQVVRLNRAGGFWGSLEKTVLEQGIKKQAGKQARMTVFNGPIFDDSKDRVFKGVKIPMGYFKVIAWLDDANKLKATAFKLSQEALVGHIDFDESMGLDAEEALDIDKVVKFTNFQISIKSLSRLTKINFNHLERFDTFTSNIAGAEANLIMDAGSIRL